MNSIPMGDATRNARQLELRICPMCERTFPVRGRGIYCGPTCRQRAFRLRHPQANRPTLTNLSEQLRRERRLVAQTVYECPACQEQFLGTRRCSDCNLMCRKIGVGGECPGCAEIVTISELLDIHVDGGASAG
jgi:hypothetical protein